MSNLQSMVTRLTELERAQINLQTYSHHDDLGQAIALALKYVRGTTQTETVVRGLLDALDVVIAEQKASIKQALDD